MRLSSGMTKELLHAKAVSQPAWVLSNSRGLTGSADYSHHATSPTSVHGQVPKHGWRTGLYPPRT